MSQTREIVPLHGSLASIGATALQLSASVAPLRNGVLIKADYANAGIVYVGSSTVTAAAAAGTDGFPIKAGESVMVEAQSASIVYAIASTTGQKVWFIGA